MGIFDFLKRKDEDEDLDLDSPEFGETPNLAGTGRQRMGQPPGTAGRGTPGSGIPGTPGSGIPGTPGGRMSGTPGNETPGRSPLFGAEPSVPSGTPSATAPGTTQPMQQPGFGQRYQQPPGAPPEVEATRNSIQLIISKLDGLKVSIDRLNDRLEYLERSLIGRNR